MKRRRRNSLPNHTLEKTQQARVDEEHGGASISDLPNQILMDIFSRLSVKFIFRCRCVSKLWLKILLDNPEFAKLHFSRAPTCPLLRDSGELRLSKALYLVELERDSICDVCDKSCNIKKCFPVCDRHVNMKIRTTFMLPERESSSSRAKIRERRYDIVNSCNGLLCLRGSLNGYPIVIYNPVTGEYSVLPQPEDDDEFTVSKNVGGLGFCSKTNQFKVLVMFTKWIFSPDRTEQLTIKIAVMYTLGSGPWRRIGDAPIFSCGILCPAFLNGALHWFGNNYRSKKFIVSFDFEGEQFHALPSPYTYYGWDNKDSLMLEYDRKRLGAMPLQISNMSMGVMRGCLYICEISDYSPIVIWVMKEYGVRESWVKAYDIDILNSDRWPLGFYQPIDYLKNGDLFMYQERNDFISYDGYKFRYFKIRQTQSKFQAIAHVPSFVSLKEVSGDDLAVLNVRSSLAKSGARRTKTERLSLVEQNREQMSSSDTSSSSDTDTGTELED